MPTKPTPEEKTESPATTTPSSATQMANDVAALQSYGFKTMSGMGMAWAEAFSDMGSEVLSFVADRIKEDVKTQHRMLHCKDVSELQSIQAEFVQTAIDQYTAETGKLVKMSQDMFSVPETDKPKGN